MATISNDSELRSLIMRLSPTDQRRIGLQFAQGVLHLCQEERVRRAIDTGLAADASAEALEDAWRAARSHATRSYTDCGKDTDWLAQADHFVAAAVADALTPDALLPEKINRAWKAAMHARMANNCELVNNDETTRLDEVHRQYAIADAFVGATG